MLKNARKVHIDGQVYHYKVARLFIVIVTPEGKKVLASHEDVSGLSWEVLERRAWKKPAFAFTPGVVKKYIEDNIHANCEA